MASSGSGGRRLAHLGAMPNQMERDPNLDPRSVADLLAMAAEHLEPDVRDDDFGAGRVDAYKALKLLVKLRAAKRVDLARP